MRYKANSRGLTFYDENRRQGIEFNLAYSDEFDDVWLATTCQEKNEQHDISINKKDWEIIKSYIDSKFNEKEVANED
ncbi:hypothetical protein [Streptococcus uberis]|uniref:hypothetical protein n=1 Tax=Streptococcus uberis TaxID=1349 RepID=UPI003D36771E